jgi:DNA polymerase-3 subunit gamma/tau
VHHAFLFTGTRGVGKTTIARIFAKCLNCETGVTAEPCGVCSACLEIDAGRFVDLIEVDAASRTKVDDTREILDNVPYAPSRGRYKVYLIDEVHMLSTHSFNALLKTLEEPPPHVKFLLATTDPQKLPVTVLSRCLQFNLKRMPVGQIAEHMKVLLEKEGVPFETAGLRLLAQAADGSMRDGLSLLDQLIAFGGGKAGEEEARAMLGTISRDHVERLAEQLATLNVPEIVKCARSLEEFSPDYAQVLDELAGLLVRVAMKQAVSDFEGDDIYAPELLERLAKALSPEDIQLFYQTAIIGRRDLALAPDPRTGFEMTLVRMIAFRPASDEGASQGSASGTHGTMGRGGAAVATRAAIQGQGSAGGGVASARATTHAGAGGDGTAFAAAGSYSSSGVGPGGVAAGASAGGAAAAARAAAQTGLGGAAAARAAAQAGATGSSVAARSPAQAAPVGSPPANAPPQASAGGDTVSAGSAPSAPTQARSSAVAGSNAIAGSRSAAPGRASTSNSPGAGADEQSPPTQAAAPTRGAVPAGENSWTAILNQLDLQGAARELARHCVLLDRHGPVVRLGLDPRVKFVRTSVQEEKLTQALSRYYGETVRLEFSAASGDFETPAQAEFRASQQALESARQAFETDPGVQGLRDRFGATLLPETIRPVK